MNEQAIRQFRERIKAGESLIGLFLKTCDPAFVEAAGWAGADFVILDREHGPISIENMQNNVRAAQVAGTLPIIRVPGATEESIAKALDIGAAGVQISQVQSARDAEDAVKFAKFYPNGERGICRFVRAAHYSAQNRTEYFFSTNQTLVIVQVESQKSIDALDEILDVQGIDILFIGPYDLSQSLGVPGEVTHAKVIEKMQKIVEAAKKKGIVIGTFTDTLESMLAWKKAGIQYISYSVDVGIFHDAFHNIVTRFKQ